MQNIDISPSAIPPADQDAATLHIAALTARVGSHAGELGDRLETFMRKSSSFIRNSCIAGAFGGVLFAAAIAWPNFGVISNSILFAVIASASILISTSLVGWAKQVRNFGIDLSRALDSTASQFATFDSEQAISTIQGIYGSFIERGERISLRKFRDLARSTAELRKAKLLFVTKQILQPFRQPMLAVRLAILVLCVVEIVAGYALFTVVAIVRQPIFGAVLLAPVLLLGIAFAARILHARARRSERPS